MAPPPQLRQTPFIAHISSPAPHTLVLLILIWIGPPPEEVRVARCARLSAWFRPSQRYAPLAAIRECCIHAHHHKYEPVIIVLAKD